jgi:hypothetical protein
MKITLQFLLMAVAICSCSTHQSIEQARSDAYRRFIAKYSEPPPPFFWQGDWADKGEEVLHAIRSGDSKSKVIALRLIGSTIVLRGDGIGGADLKTRDGIRIEVDVVPFRDVRPDGAEWFAEVKGTLESIDFDKRLIRMVVKPDNWIADGVI